MIITSGETSGVCEVARNFARNYKIALMTMFANNDKYGPGKYEARCIEILNNCDKLILIHDGISKGTANEMEMAKKLKVEYDYYRIDILDEVDYKLDDNAFKFEF